jgi:hypothetical protein
VIYFLFLLDNQSAERPDKFFLRGMIKVQIEEIQINYYTFMKNFLAMRNMALEYKIKVNRAGLC